MSDVLKVARINIFIHREGVVTLNGKTLTTLSFDDTYALERGETEGKKLTGEQIEAIYEQILDPERKGIIIALTIEE